MIVSFYWTKCPVFWLRWICVKCSVSWLRWICVNCSVSWLRWICVKCSVSWLRWICAKCSVSWHRGTCEKYARVREIRISNMDGQIYWPGVLKYNSNHSSSLLPQWRMVSLTHKQTSNHSSSLISEEEWKAQFIFHTFYLAISRKLLLI